MSTTTFSAEVIDQAFQKFQATLGADMKLRLNGRLERGLAMAHSDGVIPHFEPTHPNNSNLYKVRSSNPNNGYYMVDLHQRSCTCPDHWKGHFCKHRIAASIYNIAMQISKPPPAPAVIPEDEAPPVEEPKPVHPTPPAEKGSALPISAKDAIVWGIVWLNGTLVGVEVMNINENEVTVKALPKIVEGKKLQPQFPFEGNRCSGTVRKDEIFHVKVFQYAA